MCVLGWYLWYSGYFVCMYVCLFVQCPPSEHVWWPGAVGSRHDESHINRIQLRM